MKTFSLIRSWTWDDEEGYERLTEKQKHILNKNAEQFISESVAGRGRLGFSVDLPHPDPHVLNQVVFYGSWEVSAEGYEYWTWDGRKPPHLWD